MYINGCEGFQQNHLQFFRVISSNSDIHTRHQWPRNSRRVIATINRSIRNKRFTPYNYRVWCSCTSQVLWFFWLYPDGCLLIHHHAHLLNSLDMPRVLYFIVIFDVTQNCVIGWQSMSHNPLPFVRGWLQARQRFQFLCAHFTSGHRLVQQWGWNTGKKYCHIATVIKCPSLHALNSSLHMSETSDSSCSGSFKASFVTVTRLAFERVSMAECIMGSHTSSMFGITNIFCGRTSTVTSRVIKVNKRGGGHWNVPIMSVTTD